MYSYNQIKQVVEKKGYVFFKGHRNINIIAVRNDNLLTDKYLCDLFLTQEVNGSTQVIHINDFTTKPGRYYSIKKFLNRLGVAVMVPGQYRGLYFLNFHKGRPALKQRKKVAVYRDGNRNNIFEKGKLYWGMFGINLHDAFSGLFVGRNSAGCQVCRYKSDLQIVLDECKKASDIYGNSFTYTLLEKEDFND